jgi:acyl dehydratase
MTTLSPPLCADVHMSLEMIIGFGQLVRDRAAFVMPDVRKGHHADVEAAKSAGLRGPVAYSLHYNAHVGALLEQTFGERWTNGGDLNMAFLRPVCAGDDVSIRIGERPVDRADAPLDPGAERLQVDVYNQLGELVSAGYATVRSGSTNAAGSR